MTMSNNDFNNSWSETLLPPDFITVWDHAQKYVTLNEQASSHAGKYRSKLNPMLNVVMHLLGANSRVEKVVLFKGTQCGGTLAAMLFLCYIASNNPAPTMIVVSDEDERDDYSRKLSNILRCCSGLEEKLDDLKSKSKLELIHIPGSQIFLSTATVARSLRGKHIKNLILSETSNFIKNCQGQGDPFAIALSRMDTYSGRKKVYAESTPTDKESNIHKHLLRCEHRLTMYWACPHCGYYQSPDFFKDLRWKEDVDDFRRKKLKKGSVHLVCQNPSCSIKRIEEKDKYKMLADFKLGPIPWVEEEIEKSQLRKNSKIRINRSKLDEEDLLSFEDLDNLTGSVGIWYNPLQTPYGFKDWPLIVSNYLATIDFPEEQQPFFNNDLGLSYDGTVAQINTGDLVERVEDYKRKPLPKGLHLLTAGVDVNGSWIAVEITGWGKDKESWTVDYVELEYDPASPLAWKKLDEVLMQTFEHCSGHKMRIAAAAIDSGFMTQQVANYVRKNMGTGRNIIAIKGSPTIGRPIIDKKPREYKKDINLTYYYVGTNTAKDTLSRWFSVKEVGPCYCHFGSFLNQNYFEGLASERLQSIRKTTGVKRVWTKIPGKRNEPLDCRVYSLAALEYLLQVKNLDEICAFGEKKYHVSTRANTKTT